MMPAATCTFCSWIAWHDVLRGQSARGELVRIEPDAHRVFARAEDVDVADAVDAREFVAHLEERVVAGEERIERAVGRDQVHDHRDVGRLLFRRHADALHFLRAASGIAMATRFCTSTCAVSRLVPSLNVMFSVMLPSLVLCDDM